MLMGIIEKKGSYRQQRSKLNSNLCTIYIMRKQLEIANKFFKSEKASSDYTIYSAVYPK